jgi:hypothetical protein
MCIVKMHKKPYKFDLVSKALGPISTQKLPHGLMLNYKIVTIITNDITKIWNWLISNKLGN